MGKVFGISDLPVSTIMSPFKPTELLTPKFTYIRTPKNELSKDTFVSNERTYYSNAILKMRNGFGKLMSHLSGAKPKKS